MTREWERKRETENQAEKKKLGKKTWTQTNEKFKIIKEMKSNGNGRLNKTCNMSLRKHGNY